MIIQLKNRQTLDNIKSGLYFIIDGILYIQTVEDISTATHIELFQAIIEKYKETQKYKAYPFYLFPRGALALSEETEWMLFHYPWELNNGQKERILNAFNALDRKNKIDSFANDHYSFDYIKEQVLRSDWDKEVIEEELEFSKEVFSNQIKIYDTLYGE